jgi:phage terminase Nu1 subunit (DNA packaging protein)
METSKAEKGQKWLELPENLIGLGEAAELLGVDRQTVHNYASRGILVIALRVGKTRYYRKDDVIELKKKRGAGFRKGRPVEQEAAGKKR